MVAAASAAAAVVTAVRAGNRVDSTKKTLGFGELQLPEVFLRALGVMNFTTPTPIQAAAIPAALTHRDVIACAQTGTGKTAAFLLPTLTRLLKAPQNTALVLVPTRELGTQVLEVLGHLTRFTPDLRGCLLIGGVSMHNQVRNLKKHPRILVATPGRLVDHLRQGTVSLSANLVTILDEADRMLDMGFAPQIHQILKYLPVSRQTLLFSATIPTDIEHLARKLLRDPLSVGVEGADRGRAKPAEGIAQTQIQTTTHAKPQALVQELRCRTGATIVFVRTKGRTDRLARQLSEMGFPVARIHGGRTQAQRQAAISAFRDGKIEILVATDIAARGLDIPEVALVVNFDLPHVPEDYVHRIGRTARAGAKGRAVSLITKEDAPLWRDIQRFLSPGSGHPTPGPGPRPTQPQRPRPNDRRGHRSAKPHSRHHQGARKTPSFRPTRPNTSSANSI